MTLSAAPISVSAAGGAGDAGAEIGTPGSDAAGNWIVSSMDGTGWLNAFTRYSLVRIEDENWVDKEYHTYYKIGDVNFNGTSRYVIGSVDIGYNNVRGGTVPADCRDATKVGTAWFNTNAIGYSAAAISGGRQGAAEFIKKTSNDVQWANAALDKTTIANTKPGTENGAILWGNNHYLKSDEFIAWAKNQDGIKASDVITDGRMLDVVYAANHDAYPNMSDIYTGFLYRAATAADQAEGFGNSEYWLLNEGGNYNNASDYSKVDGKVPTETMKALLRYLYSATLQAQANGKTPALIPRELRDLSEEAIAAGKDPSEAIIRAFFDMPADPDNGWTTSCYEDGVTYRLVIETGYLVREATTSTLFAMTLRDFYALYLMGQVYHPGESPWALYGGDPVPNGTFGHCFGGAMSDTLSKAITPLSTQFRWIRVNEDLSDNAHGGKIYYSLSTESSELAFRPRSPGDPAKIADLSTEGEDRSIFRESAYGQGVGILSGYDVPGMGLKMSADPIAYLAISKTAEGETGNKEAIFTLYTDEDCTTKYGTSNPTFTTKTDGSPVKITLRQEDAGLDVTLYIRETGYPSGSPLASTHTLSETVYKITVNSNENLNAERAQTSYEIVGESGTKTGGIEVVNPLISGDASYVLYDWNFPNTEDIRSNGVVGASIGSGVLVYENTDLGFGSNGIPVFKNDFTKVFTDIPGLSSSIDGANSKVTLEAGTTKLIWTWKGWYTKPVGGTKVTEAMTFPSYADSHSQETNSEPVTYYGQWSVAIETDGSDPSGGSGDGHFFTVYFDQNYDGGGITSTLTGSCTLVIDIDYGDYSGTATTTISCESGGHTVEIPYTVEGSKYHYEMPITAAFDFPDDPVRTGHTFLGWAKTPDGTPYPASYWELDANKPTESETFYAIWDANDVTVTWDANGGVFGTKGGNGVQGSGPVTQTTTQDYGTLLEAYSTEPVRTGYTFNGWYLDANCTIAYSADYVVTTPITLYAGWTAERVIVSYYDTREGTGFVSSQTYNYNDVLAPIDGLVDTEGSVFSWWETDDGTKAAAINNLNYNSGLLKYRKNSDTGSGTMSDRGYWTLDLKARWDANVTDYTVVIKWDDINNNDGCRPKSVHVGLISSEGNTVIDEAWIDDDGTNVQKHVFEDLPITKSDASTERITYTFAFLGYTYANPDGAISEVEVDDTAASNGEISVRSPSVYDTRPTLNYSFTKSLLKTSSLATSVTTEYAGSMTFKHDLATTENDIAFSIYWQDDSNRDGVRPSEVYATLYANGVKAATYALHNSTTGHVTISSSNSTVSDDGNSWYHVVPDLQKYKDGVAIKYTIAVQNSDYSTPMDANGYTTDLIVVENMSDGTAASAYGAIISRPIDTVTPTVTIDWIDNDDVDGIRPDKVGLTLYGNEKVFDGRVVYQPSGNPNTWTVVFLKDSEGNDFPKNEKGEPIEYTAAITAYLNSKVDDPADGYVTETSGTRTDILIVATHARLRQNVTATVYWADESDRDGYRPETVKVELYADGTALGDEYTKVVSGKGNEWTCVFENMPVFTDAGTRIVYTIVVKETAEGELYGRYILTGNALNENKVKYEATYDAAKPEATLTHVPDTTTVTIGVEWGDDNNNDGARPDKLFVTLLKSVDGNEWEVVDDSLVLTAQNGWNHEVSGLARFENGEKVRYTVAVNEGQSFLDDEHYSYAVTGTLIRFKRDNDVTSVTARVDWVDDNDNDGIRPASVELELYAQYGVAEPVLVSGSRVIMDADTDWLATWNNLPLKKNGEEIKYTIKVVELPEGYDEVRYGSETLDSTGSNTDKRLVAQLYHTRITADVTVKIVWNDNENRDGFRPNSVPVTIYANGRVVAGAGVTLTADDGDINEWTYTYRDMPVYQNGEPIEYTASTNGAYSNADKYTVIRAGLTIYMSSDLTTGDVSVTFFFEDDNNADGKRPTNVKLTLLANGEPVQRGTISVTNPADGVIKVFSKLPIYSAANTPIYYSVKAELIKGGEGYTYTVSGPYGENSDSVILDGYDYNLDITFAKEREKASQSGTLYWYDFNNSWGRRPEMVTIYLWNDKTSSNIGTYQLKVTDSGVDLMKNGVVLSTGEGTTTSDTWTFKIDDLNVHENGENVFYRITVAKSQLDNFYPTVNDNVDMNASLTMKDFDPTLSRDFTVNVYWEDNGNAWQTRDAITVKLLDHGVVYQTKTLNGQDVEGNTWTVEWSNIPLYRNGVSAEWSVEVSDLERYTEKVELDGSGAAVTMIQSFGIDFSLTWDDADNADGVRPDSVDVTVTGQGKSQTVTLTGTDNVWTGTLEDLPVWKSGANVSEQIEYTITVANVNEYTYSDPVFDGVSLTEGYENSGKFAWSTTMSHERETYDELSVTIAWNDEDDRDGLRPESVSVQLYADGEAVGEPIVVTGSNTSGTWAASFEDLVVHANLGADVVYTVELVDPVDGYTSAVTGTSPIITGIEMTHEAITFDVVATVTWNDDSLKNGSLERTGLKVQFYRDGEALGEPIAIEKSAASSVDVTLNAQKVYHNHGELSSYTIKLLDADDGEVKLSELLEQGYTVTYNTDNQLEPKATIAKTYFTVSGRVYYQYDTSDDYLVDGAEASVYLIENGKATLIGSTVTGADGRYSVSGVPSGTIEIRAVAELGGVRKAGKASRELDRMDLTSDEAGLGHRVDVIINYDAADDDASYKHAATGKVYTDQHITHADGTVEHAVLPAANASVLIYKVNTSTGRAEYLTLATTDANGEYAISDLMLGTYQVTVIVNYENTPYTYDNTDAIADGISFVITGADVQWPDIKVKLPSITEVKPGEGGAGEEPVAPEHEPEPCVVSGNVYFEENGEHTTEPVANVDVYIYSNATNSLVASAKTDANGKFEVEGIPAGVYNVVYSYEGHASRVQVVEVSDSDYAAGSKTLEPVYFGRTDNVGVSEISGTILDANGNPYDVLIYVYKSENGVKGELAGCAYADEYGHYVFNVAAGIDYLVEYRKVENAVTVEEITYPASGSTTVTLTEYAISGELRDETGAPVEGAVVNLFRDEVIVMNATTDANGKYRIGGIGADQAGNYLLVFYFADGTTQKHNITIGANAPVITKGNDGKYTISGSAEGEITLRYNNNGIITTKATAEAENGAYEFTDLDAGDYAIVYTVGGTQKTDYAVAQDGIFEQSFSVKLEGSVTDSLGNVRAAKVTLKDNGAQVGDTTITLADGHYEYEIAEYHDGYTVEIEYPTTGDLIVSRYTTETDSLGNAYPDGMETGKAWIYNLNAEKATGTVKDQKGRAVEGAQVVLVSKYETTDSGAHKTYSTTTDANGAWSIGVPEGEYDVYAVIVVDGEHSYKSREAVVAVSLETNATTLVITRYDVTFTVTRELDAAALANADVTVENSSGTIVASGKTDANGALTVILTPDAYTVTVKANGVETTEEITVNADAEISFTVSVPFTVTGKVMDVNGEPAANATVYYAAANGSTKHIAADANGTFTLTLSAGTYKFYAANANGRSETVTVEVKADADITLTIAESPKGSLNGVVVDTDGNRLADATVTVLYGNDKVFYAEAQTDAQGEFSFADIEEGTYYLTAVWTDAEGNEYKTYTAAVIAMEVSATENIVLVVEYREPAPVDTSSLGESKPEVIAEAYRIAGIVKDGEGNPVDNATVSLYVFDAVNHEWVLVDTAVTGADGAYAFENLPAGEYQVRVSAETTTTVAAELGNYDIKGYALDATDAPYVGARVELYDEDGELVSWTTTDDSGYYEFTEIPAGNYTVKVIPEGVEPYEQAVFAGSAIVTVTETAPTYRIDGKVLDADGNPEYNVMVKLYKLNGDYIGYSKSQTDGSFVFKNLEAGSYKLVIEDRDYVEYIEIGANAAPEADDTNHFTIEGVVLDDNGEPVANAIVEVRDEHDTLVVSARTGEDGKYSFTLEPGNYTVKTIFDYVRDADTSEGDAEPTTFTIRGKVIDQDGNPLEGVPVKLLKNDGTDYVEIDATESDENGMYEFTGLPVGDYRVVVGPYNDTEKTYDITLPNGDVVIPDPGTEDPEPDTEVKIALGGSVISSAGNALEGATVYVVDEDDEAKTTYTATTDENGIWVVGDLSVGHYTVYAEYTHAKGTNRSGDEYKNFHFDKSRGDIRLVVTLCYDGNVNGEDTTIFAGEDDEPGTEDDYYYNDGEKVEIGEDLTPGTEDDHYVDDGDDIYIGDDKTPRTEDDYYIDDEGRTVHVGEDGQPHTPDDWYEEDKNGDGVSEKVYVGEDGIAGTDDDYWTVPIVFDATEGTIDGERYLKGDASTFNALPTATREGYDLDGWFTEADGGTKISLSDVRNAQEAKTFYAHWTKHNEPDPTPDPGPDPRPTPTPDPTPTPAPGGDETKQEYNVTVRLINSEDESYRFKAVGGDEVVITVKTSAQDPIYSVQIVGENANSNGGSVSYNFELKDNVITFTMPEQDVEVYITFCYIPDPAPYETPSLVKEHIAYIYGYKDGTIRPTESITRAEVATMLYRLLTPEAHEKYDTMTHSFSDVAGGRWYTQPVATLAKMGVLRGYPDGTFKPDSIITRAELVTMIMRLVTITSDDLGTASVPADVIGHWAEKNITDAYKLGIVHGRSASAFVPNEAITRAETVQLINNLLGRSHLNALSGSPDMTMWSDNTDPDKWYFWAIQEAGNTHSYYYARGREGYYEIWTATND